MKHKNELWGLFGFAVSTFFGTLLHFAYDLSGESALVAPFSGVNESTWEHMKLLFWPLLLFAIVQSFFFRDRKDFWCVKLWATLTGLALIPVLFYTYNGVIGKSSDPINISIFFLSAAASFLVEVWLLRREKPLRCSPRISLVLIFLLAALFVFFTFRTPQLAVFLDPITGTYGI